VAIRSSLDGFASNLHTESISNSGAAEDGVLDLTVAPGLTLEIRIYGYDANNSAGTLRIDDMQLQGEIIGAGPCSATRWAGGDTWGPNGTVIPGGHGGVVACANSAETQSGINPNCRYDPDIFTISLGECKDPNNPLNPITVNPPFAGQKVLWFNFDLRKRANKFDFQVVDNDNLAWAIYYSTVHTDTINGNGLSGDCNMISAVPLY
jgi:hypothetical protein